MMVSCEMCGTTAYPSITMDQALAMVPSCPTCGNPHRDIKANEMAETAFVLEKKAATVTPIRPGTTGFNKAVFTPTPPVAVDVFSMIQERIQFLDLEIAKSAGYSAERRKLAKMLAAAGKAK